MYAGLLPGERIDDLQWRGLRIIQHEKCFRFGMDAVLLADFARVRRGERVADLGTGTGVIAILLAGADKAAHITALELQSDMADMAARSVRLNGLEDTITVLRGDLRQAPKTLGYNGFDLVVCNPPYGRVDGGLVSRDPAYAIARHEQECTLSDVAGAAFGLLRNRGRVCIVLRADRAAELFTIFSAARLEPKRVRIICPSADKGPNLILVEAVRLGGRGVVWEPPLVIYDQEGQYTPDVRRIYHMQP